MRDEHETYDPQLSAPPIPAPPLVTLERKLRCAKRELALRRKVYPRWVQKGRMTADEAIEEIAVMEQIVRDYENLLMPELPL